MRITAERRDGQTGGAEEGLPNQGEFAVGGLAPEPPTPAGAGKQGAVLDLAQIFGDQAPRYPTGLYPARVGELAAPSWSAVT